MSYLNHDSEFHQVDAAVALRTGRATREGDPFCACSWDFGGYVICRRCHKLRRPGKPMPPRREEVS